MKQIEVPGGTPLEGRRRLTRALLATGIVGALLLGGRTLPVPFMQAAMHRGDAPNSASEWKLPLAQSWPAERVWNDRLEEEYSEFVARLGQAVMLRRCRRFDLCLRDPSANTVFDAATDPTLALDVDCGDLPYVLRGYFSFKKHLPFAFVCDVHGVGDHIRYMADVVPAKSCSWQNYKTPHQVLRGMSDSVHSGMFRMAPAVEGSDFYSVAVNRRAIRPGTVYYDPNGHVLTVAEVRADGSVFLIDGHPDGSLTWKRFGAAFALGGHSQGGGFKNFRPQRLVNSQVQRDANRELPLFDGETQWNKSLWAATGRPGTYYTFVRQSLALGTTPDAETDFREEVRAFCRDVSERVDSVQAAITAGLSVRPHPGELPSNIYGTTGEWEDFATPSRDARLRAAVREIYELVSAIPKDGSQFPRLRTAWREESTKAECRFSYLNSQSKPVSFTIDDVLERLYTLSFDPYHCPELRWGAPPNSPELASCPSDTKKQEWYEKEQRLRNRIDREYGAPTPLTSGPLTPAPIDFRALLQ